jgi:hypothetical protein
VISGTAAAWFKRLGPFDDVRITLGGDGLSVMAQICADGLGTGLDRIRVIHGRR